jgi:hypothetical protein
MFQALELGGDFMTDFGIKLGVPSSVCLSKHTLIRKRKRKKKPEEFFIVLSFFVEYLLES